jgi:hypothetical protein
MLNVRDIKKGAAGFNMPTMKDVGGEGYGYKMYVGTGAVTGSKTIDLSAIFSQIDFVAAQLEEATSTDVDGATMVSWEEPAAGQVKLWVWKATNSSTTTLVPGTTAASVRYLVIGK